MIPQKPINGFNLEIEVLNEDGSTVIADLLSFKGLNINELFNQELSFKLQDLAEGNYTIIGRVREGFRLIATTENWFYVITPINSMIKHAMTIIIIILLLIAFRYLILKH